MKNINDPTGHGESPDEKEAPPESTEFIMGQWFTKKELFKFLNSNGRVTFSEDFHDDGVLYMKVPFREVEA